MEEFGRNVRRFLHHIKWEMNSSFKIWFMGLGRHCLDCGQLQRTLIGMVEFPGISFLSNINWDCRFEQNLTQPRRNKEQTIESNMTEVTRTTGIRTKGTNHETQPLDSMLFCLRGNATHYYASPGHPASQCEGLHSYSRVHSQANMRLIKFYSLSILIMHVALPMHSEFNWVKHETACLTIARCTLLVELWIAIESLWIQKTWKNLF